MNREEFIKRMEEKHSVDEQLSEKTLKSIRRARERQEIEGDIGELIAKLR